MLLAVVLVGVAAAGRRGRGGGTRRPLPRSHRPLQAPARLPLRRDVAKKQLRQGAEDRTTPAPG
jgi:hypothetical protein